MDAADLDHTSPAAALLRVMKAGWQTFERYPLLLRMSPADAQAERDRHKPVRKRVERLVKRGQESGEFDSRLSPS